MYKFQFLSGNIDNNTPKTNILSCPFDARYLRINPITWHENIAMRFEILGCNTDGSKPTCKSLFSAYLFIYLNVLEKKPVIHTVGVF